MLYIILRIKIELLNAAVTAEVYPEAYSIEGQNLQSAMVANCILSWTMVVFLFHLVFEILSLYFACVCTIIFSLFFI